WADTTRFSWGISSSASTSADRFIVGQSDVEPMMIPTNGFVIFLPLIHARLKDIIPRKRQKSPGLGFRTTEKPPIRALERKPKEDFSHSPEIYGFRVETLGPYSRAYMRKIPTFTV